MQSQLPICVQYVQGLGPTFVAIAVGVIAATIAYWQWRTANDKLKMDLFEKRYNVYSAFLAASKAALANNPDRVKINIDFVELLWQADFLFDDKVGQFLKDANEEIARLIVFENNLAERRATSAPVDSRSEKNISDQMKVVWQLHESLLKRRQDAFQIFKPFLSFQLIKSS
jgi:hypothetical protein